MFCAYASPSKLSSTGANLSRKVFSRYTATLSISILRVLGKFILTDDPGARLMTVSW